jgi:hypothetical protein
VEHVAEVPDLAQVWQAVRGADDLHEQGGERAGPSSLPGVLTLILRGWRGVQAEVAE